jgi:hypothetical protein
MDGWRFGGDIPVAYRYKDNKPDIGDQWSPMIGYPIIQFRLYWLPFQRSSSLREARLDYVDKPDGAPLLA